MANKEIQKPKEGNVKLFAGILIGAFASVIGIGIWRILLKNASIYGIVTDAATGLPIAGATVNLTGGDGVYLTTVTDFNGAYLFDKDVKTSYILEGYPYFYFYTLVIDTDGAYQPYTMANLTFHPAVNTWNVQLEAI